MKQKIRQLLCEVFGFQGSNLQKLLSEENQSFIQMPENQRRIPFDQQSFLLSQNTTENWKAWKFQVTPPETKVDERSLYDIQLPSLLTKITDEIGLKITDASEDSQLKTYELDGMIRFSIMYDSNGRGRVRWIEFTIWE